MGNLGNHAGRAVHLSALALGQSRRAAWTTNHYLEAAARLASEPLEGSGGPTAVMAGAPEPSDGGGPAPQHSGMSHKVWHVHLHVVVVVRMCML